MEVGQRLYAFLAYNMGDAERRSRFLLSSALWSVCGFPIAVSSRHFGSFIPPARQSGKSWQGRLKYWVMKIINQQPSVEFIFYFFFSFPVSGEWAAEDPSPAGLGLRCGCSPVFNPDYFTPETAISSCWVTLDQDGCLLRWGVVLC